MASMVLVDLDDTLYPHRDFMEVMAERWQEILQEDGVKELVMKIYDEKGRTYPHLLEDLVKHYGRTLKTAYRLHREFLSVQDYKLTLYPDAEAILTMPRAKVIVTNGMAHTQQTKLVALGIDKVFHDIYVCEGSFAKPNPFWLKVAMEDYGLPGVFVGNDLAVDYPAAKAAGIDFIFVNRTGEKVDLPEGVIEVKDLIEARRVIDEQY